MRLWNILTLLMCFLCKAAGTAELQPHPWRFKSLHFAMSLGRAACLQFLNPLKTSSCICGPILSISVYCFRIFIWEIGNFSSLGLTLKSTWDWQTNKHTAIKITNPVGRHHDGRIVSQRHPSHHSVLFPVGQRKILHELCCILTHYGQFPLLDGGHSLHSLHSVYSYDLSIWNIIQLTDIMANFWLSPALPSPHLRGMWWPWCEWVLRRIVQSSTQPVWSGQSSQAGWCLAALCILRSQGDLWWNLVFV